MKSDMKINGPSVITRKTCPPKCGLSHGAVPKIVPKVPSCATYELVNFHHKKIDPRANKIVGRKRVQKLPKTVNKDIRKGSRILD